MKNKLGLLIFVAVAGGTGFFVYYQSTSICRNPLEYAIGVVDSRFGISREKLLAVTKEAEGVWEKGLGRELFNYYTDADFKINLVFDDRQKQTIEGNQSETEIEVSRSMYDQILKEYDGLAASYQAKLDNYNTLLSDFEKRLDAYNAKVATINTRGGATPKEQQELEKERKYLESQKNILDSVRSELSNLVSRVNSLGDQVNYLAEQLNIEIDVHNQIFGEAREFDQGEYNGKEINIYQFDKIADLRLVIVHELGHALGIGHVENSESVMYYLMDRQDVNNLVLSKEDIVAFVERCEPGNIFRVLKESLSFN